MVHQQRKQLIRTIGTICAIITIGLFIYTTTQFYTNTATMELGALARGMTAPPELSQSTFTIVAILALALIITHLWLALREYTKESFNWAIFTMAMISVTSIFVGITLSGLLYELYNSTVSLIGLIAPILLGSVVSTLLILLSRPSQNIDRTPKPPEPIL